MMVALLEIRQASTPQLAGLLRWTWGAARHPCLYEVDERVMGDRYRFTTFPRVEGPQHQRIALDMLDDRFQGAIAIPFAIFDRPA